jgi:hypothetical protein
MSFCLRSELGWWALLIGMRKELVGELLNWNEIQGAGWWALELE